MKAFLLFLLTTLFMLRSQGFDESHNTEFQSYGDNYAARCMREAEEDVNEAIRRAQSPSEGKDASSNPMAAFYRIKQPPNEKAMQMARAADIFETSLEYVQTKCYRVRRMRRRVNATDVLSPETLEGLAAFAGCEGNPRTRVCPSTCQANTYRPMNGECNNLNNVHWGALNNKLRRWLPAQYENGFSLPTGWDPERKRNGYKMPPVRDVSNVIVHTSNRDITVDSLYSHLIAFWGQYIDHDSSFTPVTPSTSTFHGSIDCKETCDNSPPCFPIPVPNDDPRINSTRCLPFVRSAAVCGTGETSGFFNSILPREQMNTVTSYIDANPVYGSTEDVARMVRDQNSDEGLLEVNDRFRDNGMEYLPFHPTEPCVQDPSDTSGETIPCFLAGDGRVSEQITLTAIHTLWLREHNRLAQELKKVNPHWNGEKIFQETKKIVGSLHQVIQYSEYVPKIIGPKGLEMMGDYSGYDSNVDPTVSNVFATAAFRFGHATIAPMVRRLNENYEEHETFKNILLHKVFFSPWRIIREGGLDPIFRGLIGRPAKLITSNQILNEELRERLFQLQNKVSLDLASLNLQRGRDHALPLYNDWREFCNLTTFNNFSEMVSQISDQETREKLENLYGHPGNMDLWVAGLVEDLVEGSRVGPLFLCLLTKQFKQQRDGDRFFYMNEGVHTSSQRNALNEVRLANVLCANSGLKMVQRDVFRLASFPDEFVNCESLPALNLEPWRESPEVGSCGTPMAIRNGYWFKCDSDTVTFGCNSGYTLEGPEELHCMESGSFDRDPPQCVDINECEADQGSDCEEICINTDGNFTCGCNEGRILTSDMRTCQDIRENSGFNFAAVWIGVLLGVGLIAAVIALTIAIYKYSVQRARIGQHSTHDTAKVGSIHSSKVAPSPSATFNDK